MYRKQVLQELNRIKPELVRRFGVAEKVLTYSDGLDQTQFESSGMNYDAILRNINLIGEAATHIPNDTRESNLSIPWRRKRRRSPQGKQKYSRRSIVSQRR